MKNLLKRDRSEDTDTQRGGDKTMKVGPGVIQLQEMPTATGSWKRKGRVLS